MNKQKIQKIANYILEREEIIQNKNSLDKDIQCAKKEIENRMASLSIEEILLMDILIHEQN